VVPPQRAVTATGLREIHEVRCAWPDVPACPAGNSRPCGKWHVAHRPWIGLNLDDVAEMMPERGIVPLNWFGRWAFLVSPRSRALYVGITGRSPEWYPSVRPPANRQRKRIECVKPVVATEVSCCGVHHPGVKGEPPRLACQLCPMSPTYWNKS
jgi:hypothetical protein